MINNARTRIRHRDIGYIHITTTEFKTQITLTWDRPSGLLVDRYFVYRDETLQGIVTRPLYPRGSNRYIFIYLDTGLTPATLYNYRVVATNRFGGMSESSLTTETKASDIDLVMFLKKPSIGDFHP